MNRQSSLCNVFQLKKHIWYSFDSSHLIWMNEKKRKLREQHLSKCRTETHPISIYKPLVAPFSRDENVCCYPKQKFNWIVKIKMQCWNENESLPHLFRPMIHHFPSENVDNSDPAHRDQFVVTAIININSEYKNV